MPLPAAVRPRRTMAFPFLAVLAPALWFVYRDASGVDQFATSLPRFFGLVAAAVVLSYVVAALVDAAWDPPAESRSGRLAPLVAPSNGTLAVVALVGALLAAVLLADAVGVVPRWLVTALAPFGVAVGWPVLVAIAATYGAGNALGTELPFVAQAAFLAVGIVCAVAWLFVCSSWLVSLTDGAFATGDSRAS